MLIFLFYPYKLFENNYSTVLDDRSGNLIYAKIAPDGQWRFPAIKDVPEKFEKLILLFEDEYFYYHFGINPVSISKALVLNIRASEIIRGGSTISQQVIRLSRKNKRRTIGEKIIEASLALKLELNYSKKEILNFYVSHAPFGGNVVGLEVAAWRYFGRSLNTLSWSEMASLAVLPNAPSLIRPGKNTKAFKLKRDLLLKKAFEHGYFDEFSLELAQSENLPSKPKALPLFASHLGEEVIKQGHNGEKVKTSLDFELQKKVISIVDKYYRNNRQNKVYNIACLVAEVETGEIKAYVANSKSGRLHQQSVNNINSLRSSGSVLKPLLYNFLQQEGIILPQTLIYDIPSYFNGYIPKNYTDGYDGAVPADEAIARSLNIPAVYMLKKIGVPKFLYYLQQAGFTSIDKSADHYGLSLILGGAEISLWDLVQVYSSMARVLNNANKPKANSESNSFVNFHNSFYLNQEKKMIENNIYDPGSLWLTFSAISEMNRPIEGVNWKDLYSAQKIAWKTGTSYGRRDAWTVGITSKYVVGVWVGNSNGVGRPGLSGARLAAPIVFDVFSNLDAVSWFEAPQAYLMDKKVCSLSGYLAGDECESTKVIKVALSAEKSNICPYHKKIFLDEEERFQVNSSCYDMQKIKSTNFFVLPTTVEYFYKKKNLNYKVLPPFLFNCQKAGLEKMELIYPSNNSNIFIPRGFSGEKEYVIFEAVHRDKNEKVFWYLDDVFCGTTKSEANQNHKLKIQIDKGEHLLTIVDQNGNSIQRKFSILSK